MASPPVDLDSLDEPAIRMMAVGLVRELFGDKKAERYKNAPPTREQMIRFIRMFHPEAR